MPLSGDQRGSGHVGSKPIDRRLRLGGAISDKACVTVIDRARRHDARLLFVDLEKPDYETSAEKGSDAVWAHIDRAFAEPMTKSDDQAEYAPTQTLPELFKQAGAEGVVYKSQFGEDGFNIALFDPDSADILNCGLFQVDTMKLTVVEADPFYTVTQPPAP